MASQLLKRNFVFLSLLVAGSIASAQAPQVPPAFKIGSIDFYGMSKLPVDALRAALTFKEGDDIQYGSNALAESRKRLEALRGVAHARVEVVCCDAGRVLVYVGVEEPGAPTLTLREAPTGAARLSDEIMKAHADLDEALQVAVREGRAQEDDSAGHALATDPALRAVQARFIRFAHGSEKSLREVLYGSSDAEHRSSAAELLGYADDKQAVVDALVYAISDPSDGVRNDAMRALLVFTNMTPGPNKTVPRVPYEPFVAMLNSLIWSDRNKSSFALMQLTESRDPQLLELLKREALRPLVQIARWHSDGHAVAGFVILARIAGYTDQAATEAFRKHDKEPIITAALKAK